LNTKKRIVIVGATSAIAEECARQWASIKLTHFVLLGRNLERLNRVAADLKIRYPQTEVELMEANFIDPVEIQATVNAICDQGTVSIAFIAHGSLPEQEECQENLNLCKETIEINGISPCLYAEAFAQHLKKQDQGVIALIGSVAGDRGRKSNYVYGAAKGLVTRYSQGLQHRFADTNVQITLIKPGPTDTPMTAGMKGNLASPEEVAKIIVNGIAQKKLTIYAPGKWWLIMMVVRHLPHFIFKKLNI
jgi:decaprenylphospho-beta-D-erythro-pentofuranosid-2-ulose 2-reductase